jgi:hypothetical protein
LSLFVFYGSRRSDNWLGNPDGTKNTVGFSENLGILVSAEGMMSGVFDARRKPKTGRVATSRFALAMAGFASRTRRN